MTSEEDMMAKLEELYCRSTKKKYREAVNTLQTGIEQGEILTDSSDSFG